MYKFLNWGRIFCQAGIVYTFFAKYLPLFEVVKSNFNGCDVSQELTNIKETLTKTSNDWKVRMETCAHMRSLLIAGANQYEELFMGLKTLEVAFQVSVKDLR